MNRSRTPAHLVVFALGCSFPVLAAEPEAKPPTADSKAKIEAILNAQEARGKDLKDIKCKLKYIKEDTVLNEKQTLDGELLFKEEDPNPRFMIRFDHEEIEGVVARQKQWFVFDGRWFTEARQSTGYTVKHEMLREGEKKDIFKLGEGPFPVPFGQKKKDITDTFEIKLLPPNAKTDPANSDHLECTPKPGTDIAKRYGTVHFWMDRKTNLPAKLSTVDKEDKEKNITAIFTDVQLNTGIAGSDLNLPEQTKDYKVTEDPLPSPNGEKPKNSSK